MLFSFRYEHSKNKPEKSANLALKWFENNHMKANPSKFQVILFKCRKDEEVFDLDIGDELIKPVSLMKLLGVFIDDNLNFNGHVSTLCVKHGRQMRYAEL